MCMSEQNCLNTWLFCMKFSSHYIYSGHIQFLICDFFDLQYTETLQLNAVLQEGDKSTRFPMDWSPSCSTAFNCYNTAIKMQEDFLRWTAWNFNLRIYESLCIANYHSPFISIIYLNGNYAYLIAYVGIGYVCVLAVRNTYYTEVKPHN